MSNGLEIFLSQFGINKKVKYGKYFVNMTPDVTLAAGNEIVQMEELPRAKTDTSHTKWQFNFFYFKYYIHFYKVSNNRANESNFI